MAIHSSILAWEIPWIEEPGGLQSMGSQRVRHDWVTEHSWNQTCNIFEGCLYQDYCEPGLSVAAQRTTFLQWAALVAINKEFHPLRGILMGMEENAAPSSGTGCRHAHSCQDEYAHMVLPAWLPFSAYLSPNMSSVLSAIQPFPVAVVV